MIVQVDERTDLLGYRLQCGQCHTNLTLGSQNQLSFQYLLHSGATVFSVSSVQSVTLRLFLTLSGLLQTNSLWLNSQQTTEVSSQALFLGLLAFPPGLRQSARARFRYRPDLFQSVRPLPSACITCSFRPSFFFFILFLVGSMVKKKSVPRRWASPQATVQLGHKAFELLQQLTNIGRSWEFFKFLYFLQGSANGCIRLEVRKGRLHLFQKVYP